MKEYIDFLKDKMAISHETGFEINDEELNYDYRKDGLAYLREAEMDISSPTLFDLMNAV